MIGKSEFKALPVERMGNVSGYSERVHSPNPKTCINGGCQLKFELELIVPVHGQQENHLLHTSFRTWFPT